MTLRRNAPFLPPAPRRVAVLLLAAVGICGLMALPSGAEAADPPEILEAAAVGGLESRSAALLLSGQEGGSLAVSVLPVPLPGAGGSGEGSPVVVILDIDGASLLGRQEEVGEEEGGGETAEEPEGSGEGVVLAIDPRRATVLTEVDAYALTAEGSLADFFTQAFVIERAAVTIRAGWSGVKFFGLLNLAPGEYSLRLLVRQRDSGDLALRVVPLRVPGPESWSAPPLFAEPASRWTLVRQAELAGGPQGPLFPFRVDQVLLVPATRPVIGAATARPFYLLGGGEKGGAAPAIRGILKPRDGGDEVEVPISSVLPVEAPSPPEAVAPGLLRSEFPGDLVAPGEYSLEVAVAGGPAVALPIVVAAPVLSEKRVPVWPDLLAAVAGQVSPADPEALLAALEPPTAGKVSREVARLKAAYLAALTQLTAGDRGAALAAVAEMESQGLEEGAPEEALLRGQLDVAQQVGAGRGENLLPLIQLHEELYVTNRRADRFRLAAHSRRMAHLLVDLYAETSRSQDSGTLAAAALVSLARTLLKSGNDLEGMGVLEGALEHDPRHPTALLALACGYEILGDYRHAADLLRRYLEVRPESAEGRLRLGVNLVRLGAFKPAQEMLAGAADAQGPKWVTLVAVEELASWLAEQGRREEALARLRQARGRFPDQQRLYLQEAAILAAAGRSVESRQVLQSLDRVLARGAGRREDSPRLRYSRWPEDDLEETRRTFIAQASSRLPGLVEAVVQLTAEGG